MMLLAFALIFCSAQLAGKISMDTLLICLALLFVASRIEDLSRV